jgi:hypothetical protein
MTNPLPPKKQLMYAPQGSGPAHRPVPILQTARPPAEGLPTEEDKRPPSGLHSDQPQSPPFKLILRLDQPPTPDWNLQTSEMHSHFVILINCAVSNFNKNICTHHTHPYFGAKLQKAISVWVLYSTGADISCISNGSFHSLPPEQQPMHLPRPSQPCLGANVKPQHHGDLRH